MYVEIHMLFFHSANHTQSARMELERLSSTDQPDQPILPKVFLTDLDETDSADSKDSGQQYMDRKSFNTNTC